MIIQFQTGVDVLGFPSITQHEISVHQLNTQNGNNYNPKCAYYFFVKQTHFTLK